MSTDLYTEYNAAIGALMMARQQYADACTAQGPESSAAQQAQERITEEMEHLDRVRERYDATARGRSPEDRRV